MCLISLVLVLGLAGNVLAAVTYNQYSGPANGDWNTGANWALGHVPTTSEKAGAKTVGGPLVVTSTPACGEWTLGGTAGGIITINSGGSVSTVVGDGTGRVSMGQSAGENGTLQMNGGTATFAGILDLGYAGTGTINLYGGTIDAANFAMRSAGGVGTMNITAGTLIITGDKVSLINGYVTSGWITAYGGTGTVNVDYNITNPGKTTVTASGGGSPPAQATSPNPANSATGVSITATLSWTAGSGATSHDVYFGTDSTPDSTEFIGNQAGTTYNPGTMANSTTYYWRIDEKNSYGTTTGNVWSFTTTDGGGGGTVYPYLTYRSSPTNSIVVNWWNPDGTGDSSVDYGLTSSYGSTTNVATVTNYHHVELTGLATGTTYHYRIRSSDGTTGADNTFTTAVENTTSFSFAAFGDGRGIALPGDSTLYYTRHQALCNWIAAQNNIKFVLDSGDTVWEGACAPALANYWPPYFQLESNFSKSKVKMHTLGNHEVQPTGCGTQLERYQNYKDFYAAGFPANGLGGNYEGQVYSFNYGNAHFVCLTSFQASLTTQATWLAADLTAANADPNIQWIFVWMHEPSYTTSSTHPPDTAQQAAWDSLFDQYGVDIVFAGHNHVYERSKSLVNGVVVPDGEGTVFITNGLAGANFDPISSHPLFVYEYNAQTLAVVVTINGNQLTVNAITNADGIVRDTFTLSYGAPPLPGQASSPSPANGATGVATSATLSWTAGSDATSHDVYFGTDSTPDSTEFIGNQAGTTYNPGTLANSTTYYWRIDEKNATGTTTGVVWSFTTTAAPQPPAKAASPNPANSATGVSITATLSWTAGSGATSHDVYFGTTSPGTFQGNQAGTTYNPGTLAYSTTYYWRIDEKNAAGTTTGDVWSFTTTAAPQPPGKATSPNPANGATGVGTTNDLSWTAGSGATSHDVYFGTTSPGTFRGNQAGTTYDTGTMANSTTYYWRIDEKNAAGTTTGDVWSFTTVAGGGGALPFSDGFESGNFTAGGWTTQDADATITSVSADRYAGTYGAKLAQTTWMQKAVSTVGYNTIHVIYARKAKGLDSGQNENLFVEWSIDGSAWNNLETVPTTAWALKDFTCGSGANNNANFRVRFRTNANSTSEYGSVDSVQITGTAQ